jgi:excisionase family DNA binding protein
MADNVDGESRMCKTADRRAQNSARNKIPGIEKIKPTSTAPQARLPWAFSFLCRERSRKYTESADMPNQNSKPALPTDVMTVQEAASYLRLSRGGLHLRTTDGTIPAIKLGRRVLYRRIDLNAALDRLAGETKRTQPPARSTRPTPAKKANGR